MKGLGTLLVLLICVSEVQPESVSSVELSSAAEETGGTGGCAMNTARLAAIELRLAASEGQAEQLRRQNAANAAKLRVSDNRVSEMKRESEAQVAKLSTLAAKLNASESRVERLETQNADKPQVAFSVGLTNNGAVGHFNSETNLVFGKVFVNIGNAYNPTTGVFTAPLKGAYHFRFTVTRNTGSGYTYIRMYKNEQSVIYGQKYSYGNGYDYISNGMILGLEEGDRVYMTLPGGHSLYDNTDNHNIFTGVLVYPM